MAGVAGTTLTDELNRLANGGGSYPATNAYLADAGAASVWAGLSAGNYMETVGALNLKAGRAAGTYLDLHGVCNALAGTSGLDGAEALRTMAS